MRAKCIVTCRHPGAPKDPELTKGVFYTVIDTCVYTMADETPYITIRLQSGRCIDRPRHMFVLLEDRTH